MTLDPLVDRPIAIEAFSGISGLGLGAESAGFDLALSIEIDPVISAVHKYNFPYCVPLCQDVSQVSRTDIVRTLNGNGYFGSSLTLLLMATPCQSFSSEGKRNPEDPRSQLIWQLPRLLKELQPKYFVFENVRGLTNKEAKKEFLNPLVRKIYKAGYKVALPIKCLNSCNFGVAQNRERLFLLGYREDMAAINYPRPTHGQNLLPFNTVADAIADLAKVLPALVRDRGIPATNLDYSGYRENFNLEPSGIFANCHTRYHNDYVYNHLISNHTPKTVARFKEIEPGQRDPISRCVKLAPTGLSPTLKSGTRSDKGSYTALKPIHYEFPHCISCREFARLQGFPDFIRGHRARWHSLRGLGNSVSPPVAKAIADEIIKVLGIDPEKLPRHKYPESDENLLALSDTQAANYFGLDLKQLPKRLKKQRQAS